MKRARNASPLGDLFNSFVPSYVDNPEIFLTPSDGTFKGVLKATEALYNYSKNVEPNDLGASKAFKSLVVNGLNVDQIWEEIQLQNQPMLRWLQKNVPKQSSEDLILWVPNKKSKFDSEEGLSGSNSGTDSQEDSLGDPQELSEESLGEDLDHIGFGGKDVDLDEFDDESEEEFWNPNNLKNKSVKDIEDEDEGLALNEEFGLSEFNEDREEFDEDDELGFDEEEGFDKDLFDDDMDELMDEDGDDFGDIGDTTDLNPEDEKELLFGIPSKSKKLQQREEEAELVNPSRFELQQKRKLDKIQKLEEHLLEQKSWQMSGEVRGVQRPVNSLLAEDLDFDSASKVAPVITEENTRSLEDIIKYRIKEKAFDDPVRRVLDEKQKDHRKTAVELDGTKSKKSLAEIYEEEWETQAGQRENVEEPNEEYVKLSSLFKAICSQLDALSNANYVPRKSKDEVDISQVKKDMPALQMEEAIPVTVSDASRLAPEEIYQKPKAAPVGEAELTREDKKKARKGKKESKKKLNAEIQKKEERKEKEMKLKNPDYVPKGKDSVQKALKKIQNDKNVTIVKTK